MGIFETPVPKATHLFIAARPLRMAVKKGFSLAGTTRDHYATITFARSI